MINNQKKSEVRGVQSIEIGARLLKALCEEQVPMMLKDLSQIAGFAPAQAHAYLVSYRKIGLVEKDEDTGKYQLGPFALQYGLGAMQATDNMKLATDMADGLSERTALNVAVVVWGSFGPTVVMLKESGKQFNMSTRPGTVYSMTGTASGRVFSAFLPESIAKEALDREKREGPNSGRVGQHCYMSKAEIEQIRVQNWATVINPPVPGISAYAAPVFDHTQQIVMAITIIGLDYFLEPKAQDVFVPELLKTAQSLSRQLGYV